MHTPVEKATAYHEAGHAVIAYRFNHYGGRVTIVPNSAEGTAGCAITEGESIDFSTDWEQIIVYFAGYAAERMFDPNTRYCAWTADEENAKRLLRLQPTGARRRLRAKTLRMVRKNWPQIEAVAAALLRDKTLEEEEWSIIVDAVDEGEDWTAVLEEFRCRFSEALRRRRESHSRGGRWTRR